MAELSCVLLHPGVIHNVQFTISLFQLCVICALETVHPPRVPACRDVVIKIMLA